jgi:hypothetical protein
MPPAKPAPAPDRAAVAGDHPGKPVIR